ncbi:hypothetical protein NL676_008811 [Syzygium grande]|nr:hypothetical protein NL676_008811 [Syzygium grande]
MDVSEEVRGAHRRELLAFLENDVGRMYMDDIKTMINHKRRRLVVDISDLHSFRDLAPGSCRCCCFSPLVPFGSFLPFRRVPSAGSQAVAAGAEDGLILRNPGEYMQAFSDAVTDLVHRIDGKYLKEGETVLVGFEGPFVSRRVTPRELLSEFIGSMVCVEGIVTKCSLVRPKVVKSVHFCPSTEKFTTAGISRHNIQHGSAHRFCLSNKG